MSDVTFYFPVNIPLALIHHREVLQSSPARLGRSGVTGDVCEPPATGHRVEAVTRVRRLVRHEHEPPAQAPTLGQLASALQETVRSSHFWKQKSIKK